MATPLREIRVTLPPCRVCGRSDPRRMIALMTHWFGRCAGIPGDAGYFYLCPSCHRTLVEPHLYDVRRKLAEEHPSPRGHVLVRPPDEAAPAQQAAPEREDEDQG